MQKKYKLVIFDLDGTILETLGDLTDCVNHILGVYDFPERTITEIRTFVGNGIRKLLERSAPQQTPQETIDDMFADFKEYYKDHFAIKTQPYDGITELICDLRQKGILTAVVSNKAHYAAVSLCEKYFGGLFDTVVGEREGIARKPAPDSVNEVLALLGVDRDEAVYVGDSDIDIATAHNAEMDCISVAWGFRDVDLLMQCGTEKIAYTAKELMEFITR